MWENGSFESLEWLRLWIEGLEFKMEEKVGYRDFHVETSQHSVLAEADM